MIVTSIDTETTGLDLFHGARPFLVTICQEINGKAHQPIVYEWFVDPLTRQPIVNKQELLNTIKIVQQSDEVLGQNLKFDVEALTLLCQDHNLRFDWPWDRTKDTLIASHLLASNWKHDLTALSIQYLKEDISKYEIAVKKACMKARLIAKREFPDWRTAKKGDPLTPSAKEKTWAFDMWLPRLLAKKLEYESDHPWWTTVKDYANVDSVTTLFLWKVMEKHIKSRGLWKIFLERMKLPPIAVEMEMRGITVNSSRCKYLASAFQQEALEADNICVDIANSYDYDLVVPKAGNNRSLLEFCFNVMKLPYDKVGANGYGSLDKDSLDNHRLNYPRGSKQSVFIKALKSKRKRNTAINYLKGYERYWLPYKGTCKLLHSSLNMTGTDTLRWSAKNSNSQNVSNQEDFNLRYVFGPEAGRWWICMDGQNLELRIPAYEANEKDLIWVFEHPNDPPYFGSYHFVIFDLLYPELFKKHGKGVKKLDLYTDVKSGNFAVIYGCQETKADATYRQKGAFQKIRYRFPNIAALADKQIRLANKNGYVTTIPDSMVDPKNGYPILCTRTEWSTILPTVPLNYHIQSTAMWWMASCMISCHNQLVDWRKEGLDAFITMQVHDELAFNVPERFDMWRIATLKNLMEASGTRIGVPTPVSVKLHKDNWGEGEDMSAIELVAALEEQQLAQYA